VSDIDLRLGRWQDVLQDVTCDALITDPPYSERTHGGQSDDRDDLSYAAWTADDVQDFVTVWAPRTRGWMVAITDDELLLTWKRAYERVGRYSFAAIPILMHMPRLQGDGPGVGAVYALVSRRRTQEAARWRSLPGWYQSHRERDRQTLGAKTLPLMRALVAHYSRPGDLICDPCAGGATTLLAAAIEGRRAVGSEMDPVTHAKATKRLARGYTPVMFQTEREPIDPKSQETLFGGGEK
jgi:site-specific DNA-methyltransferase (adenine-specific)